MRPDRPQNASRAILIASLQQLCQPVAAGKFIIVDEGNELAMRMLERFVSRQGDVANRLATVLNLEMRARCKRKHDFFSARSYIVVRDHD